MKYIPLVARTFIAILFLYAGINHILGFAETQTMMANKGLPFPTLLLAGTVVFQLVGAILLILGYQTKWSAILLILFLIPASFVFHSPFDPAQRIQFLKNLALIGALLTIFYHGAGPVSLDARSREID